MTATDIEKLIPETCPTWDCARCGVGCETVILASGLFHPRCPNCDGPKTGAFHIMRSEAWFLQAYLKKDAIRPLTLTEQKYIYRILKESARAPYKQKDRPAVRPTAAPKWGRGAYTKGGRRSYPPRR